MISTVEISKKELIGGDVALEGEVKVWNSYHMVDRGALT